MIAKLRDSLLPPIVLAAILACGLIAAWAIVGGFAYSLIPSTPTLYENLQITPEGKVLIAQMRPGASQYTYRTLDGQEVKSFNFDGSSLTGLALPDTAPNGPAMWAQLVIGLTEAASPPNFWYLVHDNQAAGHAYLVGYSSESKQLIGYIGQKGFRSELPPADEQFPMDRNSFVNRTSYTSSGLYYRPGYEPNISPYEEGGLGGVFIAASGKLWMVDLAKRSAENIPTPDDVLSVSSTYEPYQTSLGTQIRSGIDLQTAVRTKREIVLFDRYGKQSRSLRIPEQFLREPIQLTHWWTKEPIYVVDHWSRKGPPEVYWFDSDGKEIKHVSVPLARYSGETPESTAWTLAVFCPAPLILAIFSFIIMPVGMAVSGQSDSLSAAFGESVAAAWPGFLTVCLISLAVSVICYRRHRQQSETGAAAWAIFVLIAGPAGYVGYLLHRRWGTKETCQKCHEVSPRDRDACLHCGTVFPLPVPKGIEILA
jgi:hypothetical protein